MEIIKGIRVYKGIAIGKLNIISDKDKSVLDSSAKDVDEEIMNFTNAKIIATKQLEQLYANAAKEVGIKNASCFEMQKHILDDMDFNKSVIYMIQNQHVSASRAVAVTGDNFSDIYLNMENDQFKIKGEDFKDVAERLCNLLNDKSNSISIPDEGIAVCNSLTAKLTVQIDKRKIIGLITLDDKNNRSLTLSKGFGIPSVCGTGFRKEWIGRLAIIDGYCGTLIISPDKTTYEKYRNMKENEENTQYFLYELIGKRTMTKFGRYIKLHANINCISDIDVMKKNDAEGIGLFRTELLLMNYNHFPSEDEQYQIYKNVVKSCGDKKVIFRTFDITSDMNYDLISQRNEVNPALGCRGIRLSFEERNLFKAQLRALYRASSFGKVGIMFPMISCVEEIQKIRDIFGEVQQELKLRKQSYGNIEVGIMIETPAAALISDDLAKEVDFFSIGTNDLTQFCIGADRDNIKVDDCYNQRHQAVLRLIKMSIDNAHRAGIWVGVSGELASDLEMVPTLVAMGVDELSVNPSMILQVRKVITECE